MIYRDNQSAHMIYPQDRLVIEKPIGWLDLKHFMHVFQREILSLGPPAVWVGVGESGP